MDDCLNMRSWPRTSITSPNHAAGSAGMKRGGTPLPAGPVDLGTCTRAPRHPLVAAGRNNLAVLRPGTRTIRRGGSPSCGGVATCGHGRPRTVRTTHAQQQEPQQPGRRADEVGSATLKAEPLYVLALQLCGNRRWGLGAGETAPRPWETWRHCCTPLGDTGMLEPLFRRAIAVYEATLGAGHVQVGTAVGGLAELYRKWGRYDDAEPLSRKALAVLRGAPTDPSTRRSALALNDRGKLLVKTARYDEELGRTLHTVTQDRRAGGSAADHPNLAITLHNLSELRRLQGRFDEAELFGQRSLRIWEDRRSGHPPLMAFCLSNLAELCLAQGRAAEAESFGIRALQIRERWLAPDHPHVAEALEVFAAVVRATCREKEALTLEARAPCDQERARLRAGRSVRLTRDVSTRFRRDIRTPHSSFVRVGLGIRRCPPG